MPAALLVPHDLDLDVRRVDVNVGGSTIARLIGAEWFDLVTDAGRGFAIAVDDNGLWEHPHDLNVRATGLAQTFGRCYDYPLVGDALIIGIGLDGETVDAPAGLLAGFAGLVPR